MNKKSEEVMKACEESLGRKLSADEALVLGITYAMAFQDGIEKVFDDLTNSNNELKS